MGAWLRFFRVVNLPTVPGDVLAGAAAVAWGAVQSWARCWSSTAAVDVRMIPLAAACLASLLLYLFGLADNDIVGMYEDGSQRPISAGEISLGAARMARGLCLFATMIAGALANLPPAWWVAAFSLAGAVVLYNRTKWALMMGLCRGLNVVCGGAVVVPSGNRHDGSLEARFVLLGVAVVWTLYVACVTKYSEGEEADSARRRRVGFLIGALVYLQLGVLLLFYLLAPSLALRSLLLVGAGLLILLRLLKRAFPNVSAS